jgi:hypothetical protein
VVRRSWLSKVTEIFIELFHQVILKKESGSVDKRKRQRLKEK